MKKITQGEREKTLKAYILFRDTERKRERERKHRIKIKRWGLTSVR